MTNTTKKKQYPPAPGRCDVSVRMPIPVRDRLDQIAQREDRSRNNVVVTLLKKALGMVRGREPVRCPTCGDMEAVRYENAGGCADAWHQAPGTDISPKEEESCQ